MTEKEWLLGTDAVLEKQRTIEVHLQHLGAWVWVLCGYFSHIPTTLAIPLPSNQFDFMASVALLGLYWDSPFWIKVDFIFNCIFPFKMGRFCPLKHWSMIILLLTVLPHSQLCYAQSSFLSPSQTDLHWYQWFCSSRIIDGTGYTV